MPIELRKSDLSEAFKASAAQVSELSSANGELVINFDEHSKGDSTPHRCSGGASIAFPLEGTI
jgi:hypothetical protein